MRNYTSDEITDFRNSNFNEWNYTNNELNVDYLALDGYVTYANREILKQNSLLPTLIDFMRVLNLNTVISK